MSTPQLTFQDVLGKQLSDTTKKNYESCIRLMREKMTQNETEEFLDSRGWLRKPMHHDIGARILHECSTQR